MGGFSRFAGMVQAFPQMSAKYVPGFRPKTQAGQRGVNMRLGHEKCSCSFIETRALQLKVPSFQEALP